MPRLGDDNSSTGGGVAQAYPGRNSSFLRIAAFLLFILFLKNVMFTDYRTEEIGYLKAAGKTEEDIAKFMPPTTAERNNLRKSTLNDFLTLKADVANLKNEVEKLKAQINGEQSGLNTTKKDAEPTNLDKEIKGDTAAT